MKDKPISVGDLIVIVGSCCDKEARKSPVLGSVHKIAEITTPKNGGFMCPNCGVKIYGVLKAIFENNQWAPVSWLKRIDPMNEMESRSRKEEIQS